MNKFKVISEKTLELISFYKYKRNKLSDDSKSSVFINLNKPNLYSRYLYLLVKFFNIEGYAIYFPNDIRIYRKLLKPDPYLSLLIEEKIISFKHHGIRETFFELNDNNISPEYYSFLIERDRKEDFHIPMSFHPLFYHRNLWDANIDNKFRKRSVFMIGNFESETYDSLEFSLFGVHSRTQIINTLRSKDSLYEIRTKNGLDKFVTSAADKKCILIDRNKFSIEIENLRDTLSQFYFFMACPGVVIPHSHNLIEALSVGCIPIIQESYASVMHPPLKNMETAIIFSNLEDLTSKLNLAYRLTPDKLSGMQNNAFDYYSKYLTPKNVIKKIMDKRYSQLYLQAEFDSVRHLKLQKAYKKVGKPKPKYT